MKIVLTGDLHLGRTSTRLPEEWRQQCRSVSAWLRLVDAVIAARADVLLLSGDTLDHRNHLWEAMGPLQQGINQLSKAGVRCLAVSGNHDAGSIPEIAAQFPEEVFTLLGKNGQWQRETLSVNGQPMLHVDGWSFPGTTVKEDPTLHYPSSTPQDGLPVLAMVHGDPGVADSKYAPLNLFRLQSLPVSAWLLGHIHRPSLTEGAPWVLMPGSPHPLDPGEPGYHHAWIIEVKDGALSPPEPFCPAVLQYSEITLPIAVEDQPGIDLLREKIQQAVAASLSAQFMLVRLRLSGQSEEVDAWEACTENLHEWSPETFRIESVQVDIHPAIQWEEVEKAGPVPELLVKALKELPPELKTRLDQLCDNLNRKTEFAGKGLPPLEPGSLPLDHLLEKTLWKTLEQLT